MPFSFSLFRILFANPEARIENMLKPQIGLFSPHESLVGAKEKSNEEEAE